ncbi:50S ribosomal protein L10 [Candidatus Jorgensenbacteria bacterium RIFCSPLOWO2_12_FULL_42_11]|uniref:Large ribosomal subunit protein uL10 n=1 Tax=Candidatus Jorgensenbacteria bacterium RIFCSPLOWO2_12_FULL_42_11 TaxID=1798473 RepID=A0A1F6C1M1_9BACT|nr:MAG: 50S ribosomal protein L10 [Candidatus Jorgensenbacteria bacterium RIFCSPLOWO2_12_FULL_42_11]
MKSKEQKNKEIKAGEELFGKSQSLIFVDFGKIPTQKILSLKKKLKELGVQFKVIKKRLLKIIFKKSEIDFDPQSVSGGQMGTIFALKDIYSTARLVYKFFESIKILGAYDLKEKQFLESDLFKKIALLPSREVLLAQLAGVLTAPLKMFLYILNEKSKQMVEK